MNLLLILESSITISAKSVPLTAQHGPCSNHSIGNTVFTPAEIYRGTFQPFTFLVNFSKLINALFSSETPDEKAQFSVLSYLNLENASHSPPPSTRVSNHAFHSTELLSVHKCETNSIYSLGQAAICV
jgi:hypothetical protein